METKQSPEIRVYAVGTDRGNPVVWALVNGGKWAIPTNVVTMARLAERGVPVKNEG